METAASRRLSTLLSRGYGQSACTHVFQRQTYSSAGDVELDLAAVGAHEGGELLSDGLQDREAVVLGEGLEEVLDEAVLVRSDVLLELRDNGLLVGRRQRGRRQQLRQLGVLLEDGGEALEGLGRGLERGRLGRGRVLSSQQAVSVCLFCFPANCVPGVPRFPFHLVPSRTRPNCIHLFN